MSKIKAVMNIRANKKDTEFKREVNYPSLSL